MTNEPRITPHRCPSCGREHARINQAVECCHEPGQELTASELEAIGQQRLFE